MRTTSADGYLLNAQKTRPVWVPPVKSPVSPGLSLTRATVAIVANADHPCLGKTPIAQLLIARRQDVETTKIATKTSTVILATIGVELRVNAVNANPLQQRARKSPATPVAATVRMVLIHVR